MTLWLLRPVEGLLDADNPWKPWYDKSFGFVVRAETETSARTFADEKAGDENRGSFLGKQIAKTSNPWLDPRYSTCIPLTPDHGPTGVIMQDFASA